MELVTTRLRYSGRLVVALGVIGSIWQAVHDRHPVEPGSDE
jgi:hypothetical protein